MDPNLFATPVPFTTRDGQTYLVGPMTGHHESEFVRWVQFKPWHRLKQVEGISAEQIEKCLEQCINNYLTYESESVSRELKETEGLLKLLAIILNGYNAEFDASTIDFIAVDDASEIITLCRGLTDAMRQRDKKKLDQLRSIVMKPATKTRLKTLCEMVYQSKKSAT